jgi:NTE family protein
VPSFDSLDHPVRRIPGDPEVDSPDDSTALCLSGGGYRAMLFHVGALWRLNELGYLRRLGRISSVSGGSIAAAVLARAWNDLAFDEGGVAAQFEKLVAERLRDFAGNSIDWKAVLGGMVIPGQTVNDRVSSAYRRLLFGDDTLQDLPNDPVFILNSTNLQSGALWRFSKRYMADYRVGMIERPTFSLAKAVSASSAFPPPLSPAIFTFAESDYTPSSGQDLQRPPFTTRVILSDGGVYDNLGLETAWKRCRTVLVSDGGGHMAALPRIGRNWASQGIRVSKNLDNQVRALRKSQIVEGYKSQLRAGTYWGIRSHVADYPAGSPFDTDPDKAIKLADLPTRLASTKREICERLINWGYAICDTAMRSHMVTGAAPPANMPYPGGIG